MRCRAERRWTWWCVRRRTRPAGSLFHAEIKQGAGSPKVVDLTLPEKKAFFIGGQHYKEGNVVLAFTLNP